MLNGISSSISGMLNALRRTETTAHNIANVQTPNFTPLRTDSNGNPEPTPAVSGETEAEQVAIEHFVNNGLPVPSKVDLTTEMTNLLLSKRAFQANAAALKSQDETLGDLLDRTR
jgi:flagellar basal body rod protein FlgG